MLSKIFQKHLRSSKNALPLHPIKKIIEKVISNMLYLVVVVILIVIKR